MSQQTSPQKDNPWHKARNTIILLIWGGVLFQIAINIIASAIYPSIDKIISSSWAWVAFEGVILITLVIFHPSVVSKWFHASTALKWTKRILLVKKVLIGFILCILVSNLCVLLIFHLDVPASFFHRPKLLYTADWLYSLNGWTSPPAGASAQAWSVSHDMLVSSGQPTTFPCSNRVCYSSYSTIIAPVQPGEIVNIPGNYGVQDYAVEATIRLDGEYRGPGSSHACDYTAAHGFGIGLRRYYNGNYDEGYGFRVLQPSPGEECIALYGQPDQSMLTSTPYPTGYGWQIYRIEVQGRHIRLLVNGKLVFDQVDTRFIHGGSVEIWEASDQVSVESFSIYQL